MFTLADFVKLCPLCCDTKVYCKDISLVNVFIDENQNIPINHIKLQVSKSFTTTQTIKRQDYEWMSRVCHGSEKVNQINFVKEFDDMFRDEFGKICKNIFLNERANEFIPSNEFIYLTSLIINGLKNNGTPFHLDPTDAYNLALAYDVYSEEALSLWTFISTKYLEDLNEFFSSQTYHVLTPDESQQLLDHIKEKYKNQVIDCYIIKQHAGEKITIPCDYVHQVYNYVNHVKLAYDYIIPSRMNLYIDNLKLKLNQNYKWLFNGADYIHLDWVLKSIVYTSLVSSQYPYIIFSFIDCSFVTDESNGAYLTKSSR